MKLDARGGAKGPRGRRSSYDGSQWLKKGEGKTKRERGREIDEGKTYFRDVGERNI
ncbi:XRE family transcriptional regulator [Sesbania bispinosa]|nr:XRE family transcriptional regulator [Sesbania bispinosa]